MKSSIIRIIKLLLSATLIGYLFGFRVDIKEVLKALSNVHVGWLAAAASLHVSGLLLSAVRWHILLKAQNIRQPVFRLFSYYLVGFFFNMFLPTQVGGDFMRIYDTSKDHGSAAKPLAAVLVERVSGLLILMLIASVVLIIRWDIGFDIYGKFPGLQIAIWIFIVSLLAGSFLFHPGISNFISQIAEKLKLLPVIKKAIGKILDVFKAFQEYGHNKRYLAGAFFVSFILQFNYILHFYLIAKTLAIPVTPAFFLVIIPIRCVALTIPFFINGIGLREFFDVTVFSLIGASQYLAVAFAELEWLLQIGFALIGGLIYVVRRREKPGENSQTKQVNRAVQHQ